MTRVGEFSYKYSIKYSLFGFILFHLTLIAGFLLDFDDAYPVWYLINTINSVSGYLIPEKGDMAMILVMFFWGSAGFLFGYVQDRLGVAEVKTIKRSDKNKNMTNSYIDKIIKNLENKKKKKRASRFRSRICPIFIIGGGIILFFGYPSLRPYNCSYFGGTDLFRFTLTVNIFIWIGFIGHNIRCIFTRIVLAIITGISTFVLIHDSTGEILRLMHSNRGGCY